MIEKKITIKVIFQLKKKKRKISVKLYILTKKYYTNIEAGHIVSKYLEKSYFQHTNFYQLF